MSTVGSNSALIRRHLLWGWWSLLIFVLGGVGLEALHGFKVDLYLNVDNETRRLMWRLAHAHGTLLSLVHIAFAATLWLGAESANGWKRTSGLLAVAGVLIPVGFFLGGITIYRGDPGIGILLLPVGAVCLIAALWRIARAVSSRPE